MSAASDTAAPLKVIFMGTPDFSVPALSAILDAGHEVAAAYSQPPSRSGRGHKERPSPVHTKAEQHGIPVFTPKSLKSGNAQAAFADLGADIAVVAAYGLILPKPVLEAPRLGCLNIHASLLPRWRGAAPIQRAIIAGDRRTGINIMQMDEGLDTGPVCLSDEIEITPQVTAGQLHDLLSELGGTLITEALRLASRGQLACSPQPDTGATYAKKIEKSEARIDWHAPAETVANHIRGLSPRPGAWFEADLDGKTERIKLLLAEVTDGIAQPGSILDDRFTIACAHGAIRPITLQRAGKKPMDRDTFLRGFPVTPTSIRLR